MVSAVAFAREGKTAGGCREGVPKKLANCTVMAFSSRHADDHQSLTWQGMHIEVVVCFSSCG